MSYLMCHSRCLITPAPIAKADSPSCGIRQDDERMAGQDSASASCFPTNLRGAPNCVMEIIVFLDKVKLCLGVVRRHKKSQNDLLAQLRILDLDSIFSWKVFLLPGMRRGQQ
jgi:hypothetical protein